MYDEWACIMKYNANYSDEYRKLLEKIDSDELVLTFPVMWEGWECDYTAWIRKDSSGRYYLVTTNHGCVYVHKTPTDPSLGVNFLEEKLEEYKGVSEHTELALKYLKGKIE